MTIPIQVNVVPLPTCDDCGTPLRRAESRATGLCCCKRGTCNEPEPFGCVYCGAYLMGRTAEVIGVCLPCQVVAPPMNGGTQ